MPRNHHFSFKQFTVRQESSAMKVCTDACLFGAWADVTPAGQVLDIGTGTGLLSLMAAQRNPDAMIEGVEIDEGAYNQAARNFHESPFAARLKVHHTPIQAFFPGKKYDCIISNPPFFQNDLRSPDQKTSTAHHAEALCFQDLLTAVERLLLPGGSFHLLLPVAESKIYESRHNPRKWTVTKELLLAHRPGFRPFRRMMTFRFLSENGLPEASPLEEKLYIYDEKGLSYDPAFKEYLKAFYLGF